MMNIMHVKCFWEVVKTQNFTEAAERLFLTQPTVSKNISALEKELGFLLFERRGRTMVLTPEGQKLLKNFGEMIAANERAEEAVEEIRKTDRALRGECVRLSLLPVVERLDIIAATNRFADENPSFKPAMDIMDESQVLLSLEAGHCDVAFCSSLMLDKQVHNMQKYSTNRFNLVVSASHPMASRESLCLKDLKGSDLVFMHPESMLWGLCVSACEAAGFYPAIALSTCRPDVALEYVKTSRCIYMAPDFEAKDYRSPELYRVIDLRDSPVFDYVFAWRKAGPMPPAALKYIEYMKRG